MARIWPGFMECGFVYLTASMKLLNCRARLLVLPGTGYSRIVTGYSPIVTSIC